MIVINEKECSGKVCHLSKAGPYERSCSGSVCMAWQWVYPGKVEGFCGLIKRG